MSAIQQILESIQKSNEVMATNVVKISESTSKTRDVLEEQQHQERSQKRIRRANELRDTSDSQSDTQYQLIVTAKQILAAIKELDVGGSQGPSWWEKAADFTKNKSSKGAGAAGGAGAKKQEGGYIHKAPVQAFQGGGGVYTVPGNSTGDNHDMMLPEGSFVLNREASRYLQNGGEVGAAMPFGPANDMVPVKTESQEMIFGPKSWNSLIPILNDLVPRFPSSKTSNTNHYATGGNVVSTKNHFASGGFVGSNNVQDIGKKDYKGRAIKLSPGAAQGFKAMIKDGMPFKSNDVTNVYRDEREYLRLKNAGYSPATNSMHNHGNAADLQGGMNSWIRQNGSKYGWKANDYAEGTNWHFEYHGPAGSKSTPPAGAKESKKTEEFVPQQEKESKSGGSSDVSPGENPQSPSGPLGWLGNLLGGGSPIGTMQKSGVDGGASTSGTPQGTGNLVPNIFGAMGNMLSSFGAKNFEHMGQMIWSSLMAGQGLPGGGGGGGVASGGAVAPGQGGVASGAVSSGQGAAGMMSYNPTSVPSGGQQKGDAPAAALPGGVHKKAKMMHDHIVSKGYTSAQAKGIVANIQRESTFDPYVRSGDDGGPGGLFQWKGSRQTPEVGRLVDSGDWRGQIDYALKEDVGPRYKSETAGMNAHEASMWWAEKWERPASLTNANNKHSSFIPSYKFQQGGKVNKFQSGGMVPVKVESGEKIFMPGTFGPEIPKLNKDAPRFGKMMGGSVRNTYQTGGSIGGSSTNRYQTGGSIGGSSTNRYQTGGSVRNTYQTGGSSTNRYQTGGSVTNNFSNSPTMVTDRFREANIMQNSQQAAAGQPIVVPMPVMTPGDNPGAGIQGGSETNLPELTASPSNYLASALLMQSHALMQRIG